MNRRYWLRVMAVFGGSFLMGVGIQLIVSAGVGFDSVSTLILGLMRHTSLPFNRWSQLLSLLFLLITFAYDKRQLGLGSVINSLLVGEAIRITAPIAEKLSCLSGDLLVCLAGFTVMALGTGLYLAADLGVGPLEGMMQCLCKLLHLSLKYGRIVLDFLIVLAGVLLGSSVGIGTIFAVFLLGPLIAIFFKLFERLPFFAKPRDSSQGIEKENEE